MSVSVEMRLALRVAPTGWGGFRWGGFPPERAREGLFAAHGTTRLDVFRWTLTQRRAVSNAYDPRRVGTAKAGLRGTKASAWPARLSTNRTPDVRCVAGGRSTPPGAIDRYMCLREPSAREWETHHAPH